MGGLRENSVQSAKITILKPGIVIGDIRTPAISIEAGAFSHGLSDMGTDQWIEDRSTIHENVLDLPVHREPLHAQGY
jgi:cytoskeletal protein CcmA (bactofilin family)